MAKTVINYSVTDPNATEDTFDALLKILIDTAKPAVEKIIETTIAQENIPICHSE